MTGTLITKKSDIPASGRLGVWQGGEFSWYPHDAHEGYYYCQILGDGGDVVWRTTFDGRFLRELIMWKVERGLFRRRCEPLHTTQQVTRDR
ncbi:hypothetical protein HNR23_002744 [Nocardiopsis mwathae]|uniref:Uncharacterized protein n=1 Tax=Nocardiopsis mwathae TaxID=1472723 RepID=A0A7X0D747_9ACTN|nr:hypothetical protein [Nocardiopsis mwathae]MBB6172684.1 hypothetical protein [Nocardiopsis mwathae]